MPSIRARIADAAQRFAAADLDAPRFAAELLMAHALGCDRTRLILQLGDAVAEDAAERFEAYVLRRLGREPVAHILGEWEFFGLAFRVDRRALIPRPESEMLVQTALDSLGRDAAVRFADFGTGTGALAVAFAVNRPESMGVALDRSSGALALARTNLALHGLSGRVAPVLADYRNPPIRPGSLDLVLANPPYVAGGALPTLAPEVRDFDPLTALVPDGKPDSSGLEGPLDCAASGLALLKPGGLLLVEIGSDQDDALAELIPARFPGLADFAVETDFAGLARMLRVVK